MMKMVAVPSEPLHQASEAMGSVNTVKHIPEQGRNDSSGGRRRAVEKLYAEVMATLRRAAGLGAVEVWWWRW